jgi:hypothetical protein
MPILQTKITPQHVEKIYSDPKMIVMHSQLLAASMAWIEKRLLDNAPFSEAEAELVAAAYALAESITQMVNAS